MLLPWIVFPLVLALLSLGCGLLVERAAGGALPGALLLPLGLAALVVEADLATMSGATAQLAAPLAIALAVAGFGLAGGRLRRPGVWATACGAGAFAAYAAPIVFSGQATFAGYITLDDTATWLALTDRVMDHGRTLSGLAPSTYQQVLDDYLSGGYPLGAFMPLGLGGKLTGQDIAWLFQPTIAFYGAMLALSIYAVDRAARLVASAARPRRLPRRAGSAPLCVLALERDQGGRRRGDDRARLRLGRRDDRPLGKPARDAAERARGRGAARRAQPGRRRVARRAGRRRRSP